MKIFNRLQKNVIFIAFILFFSFFYLGAISIYQTSTINSDGSGTLKLTYSAPESDVKANNNIIGNFPFTPELIKQYFASANTVVNNPLVYKDKNNANLLVATVTVDFKNINKLSDAKGFSEMNISYNENTNKIGKLFRWVIQPSQAKLVGIMDLNLTFECDSLNSSNGIVKGKTITYYKDSKKIDFTKEVVMSATVYTSGKTTSVTSNKEPGSEPKSCGLFGFEFPALLIAGMIFSYSYKLKKN